MHASGWGSTGRTAKGYVGLPGVQVPKGQVPTHLIVLWMSQGGKVRELFIWMGAAANCMDAAMSFVVGCED